MTISNNTKHQIRLVRAHPYAGMRILPFIGDYADQARGTINAVFNDGAITNEEREELFEAISRIEKRDDQTAYKFLDKFLYKQLYGEEAEPEKWWQ